MDRYYFHVRRGQVTFLDNEGIELADLEEAAQEAARRAWQIEARKALTASLPIGGMIIVDDEFRTVLELHFDGVPQGRASFLSVSPAAPD